MTKETKWDWPTYTLTQNEFKEKLGIEDARRVIHVRVHKNSIVVNLEAKYGITEKAFEPVQEEGPTCP